MKDTVQELVDALDVMTTPILERITDTWILRLKIKPETSDIFLTLITTTYYLQTVLPLFSLLFLSDLSIDAMDVAGEQQLDVEHNLFKQRLDKDLKPVTNEAEKHGKI